MSIAFDHLNPDGTTKLPNIKPIPKSKNTTTTTEDGYLGTSTSPVKRFPHSPRRSGSLEDAILQKEEELKQIKEQQRLEQLQQAVQDSKRRTLSVGNNRPTSKSTSFESKEQLQQNLSRASSFIYDTAMSTTSTFFDSVISACESRANNAAPAPTAKYRASSFDALIGSSPLTHTLPTALL
jgi:hypothetical protein